MYELQRFASDYIIFIIHFYNFNVLLRKARKIMEYIFGRVKMLYNRMNNRLSS